MIPAKSAWALRAGVTGRLGTDIKIRGDAFPCQPLTFALHLLDQGRRQLILLPTLDLDVCLGNRALQSLVSIMRLPLTQRFPDNLARAAIHAALDLTPDQLFELRGQTDIHARPPFRNVARAANFRYQVANDALASASHQRHVRHVS
jgi:hypothetical protein